MAKEQMSIMYVDRTGFTLYAGKQVQSSRFDFAPSDVQDLEVINRTALEQKIAAFIDQNQIPKGPLFILLASVVYFEKDFQNIPPDQQELVVETYLENIPFENVSTKIFPITTGFKVITTNKELYESIKTAFEARGFVVEAVTPAIILGSTLPDNAPSLSLDLIPFIFQKYNVLKQNSFTISRKLPQITNQPGSGEHKRNVRLILLSAVLLLLVAILVFAILKG